VAEQKREEGEARTRFCVARAAEGGDAVTVLLNDVFLPHHYQIALVHGRTRAWNNIFGNFLKLV
jgi:hypothetical protein